MKKIVDESVAYIARMEPSCQMKELVFLMTDRVWKEDPQGRFLTDGPLRTIDFESVTWNLRPRVYSC